MKEKSRLFELLRTREFTMLPGNIAYSFLMSIIPILSVLLYFLFSFNLPMTVLQDFMVKNLPNPVVEFFQPVFNNEIPINQFITLLFSFIVMTNSCNSIIVSSNTVFNFENGPFLKRMVKSLLLSIVLIILMAFMLLIPLFGKSIINLVGIFTDFVANHRTAINTIYTVLQIPVSLIVMFLIIKLIYVVAPDDKVKGKNVNKGALFTTISWLIVTIIYSYYINNIARYNLVYGNLANLVILMLWFYLLAYMFVIGLCMNRIKREESIEMTNKIKLDEIRKKIQEEQKKE